MPCPLATSRRMQLSRTGLSRRHEAPPGIPGIGHSTSVGVPTVAATFAWFAGYTPRAEGS